MKKKLGALLVSVMFVVAGICTATATKMTTTEADAALLQDINDLRVSKGLNVVEGDVKLLELAQIRAAEVLELWSRDRPDGGSGCALVLAEVEGSLWAGENLACLSRFSDRYEQIIFKALCDSQAHYDNFVYGNFTKCGVYTLQGEEKTVTVILFAG